MMNVRNPKYSEHGSVECEVEHPVYGWIPFHAVAGDPESDKVLARIAADALPIAAAPPPPPPPIPTRVTMRQARRALYDAGLLDHVNAAVAAFPGDIGDKARIDWEYAQDIKRDDPIVQAMIPSLGLTEPQLDALFTAAAAL